MKWSTALENKLRGTGCFTDPSDTRLRTPSTGSYVYADVSVVRGEPIAHADATDTLTNPTVVVEVLSPATADYDRGKKFDLYREITSLQEYVLVHTDAIQVVHFSRQADGSWVFREYKGGNSTINLASMNCSVRLGDVYADLPS